MRLASSLHIAVTLLAVVPAAQAQIDEARPPADRGTPPERILEQGNAQAPASLRVVARCSDVNLGTGVAEFTWVSRVTDARAQRIDISMSRDGFQTERFETVARLPTAQNRLVWDDARPGINYYWRVLVLTPQGWVPSETARYEAPICPVDFVEPPRPPR
jgi:hypothetical protein